LYYLPWGGISLTEGLYIYGENLTLVGELPLAVLAWPSPEPSSPSVYMKRHLSYSRSAGGRDLSSDTQIRVIVLIELEICRKTLGNLSEKLGGKFPSSSLGYSMVRICRFDDTFLGILELKASPVEGQSEEKQK